MNNAEQEGILRAANILGEMAMAFDEAPDDRVTRAEVATTLRDVRDALLQKLEQQLEAGSIAPAKAEGKS